MTKKSNLLIPFTYYQENMIVYVDRRNESNIFWDRESNIQVYKPYKIRKFDSETEEVYNKRMNEYENDLAQFEEKIASGQYTEVSSITWKENFEFEDELYLAGMLRGRSAANFNLISQVDGKEYNMFMTDIVDMIQGSNINKGLIKGTWTFVKRGSNYGIKLVEQV